MRGLQSEKKPDSPPPDEPHFFERPSAKKVKFLGCHICEFPEWRCWKNTGGQTEAIWAHLLSDRKHAEQYQHWVLEHKLKGWETLGKTDNEQGPGARPQFTLEGFYERLVCWIAVDDQSLNVVDCKELRDLLLYIGTHLEDDDIPHRMRLSDLIMEQFKAEVSKLIENMKNACGRVSMTTDLWTRLNQQAYMAVTAHWVEEGDGTKLKLKSRLIAFRLVSGSHDGVNLAKHFFKILEEFGLLRKLGCVTLDNASNCNSMMGELVRMLEAIGIAFDIDGNRIRCFPHIVNLCVKAGLKCLTQPQQPQESTTCPAAPEGSDADINALEAEVDEYSLVLLDDVVTEARNLVTACRASGQRREDFANTIREGNEASSFGDEPLREVVLLKDMDVRWSSTFLMIDRVLELYPAIRLFLDKEKHISISHNALDELQLKVLSEIREFLSYPHAVQELVSAEQTPTLPVVLPLYEHLISLFKHVKNKLPDISHGVDAAIKKLETYLQKTRRTRVYAAALVINPTIKLAWLQKHWSESEVNNVRQWITDAMLEYQKSLRAPAPPTSSSPSSSTGRPIVRASSASNAARAQRVGIARILNLERSFSAPSLTSTSTGTDTETQSQGQALTDEEREAAALEKDKRIVEAELKKYLDEGILEDDAALEDFDILNYWCDKKHRFPLLYRVALDILPVQASSVPSERVFSSGKETDTLRRSNLSPEMMEMLQVLKYSFKAEHLDFSNDWVACEEELLPVTDVEP